MLVQFGLFCLLVGYSPIPLHIKLSLQEIKVINLEQKLQLAEEKESFTVTTSLVKHIAQEIFVLLLLNIILFNYKAIIALKRRQVTNSMSQGLHHAYHDDA